MFNGRLPREPFLLAENCAQNRVGLQHVALTNRTSDAIRNLAATNPADPVGFA